MRLSVAMKELIQRIRTVDEAEYFIQLVGTTNMASPIVAIVVTMCFAYQLTVA